MKARVFVLEVPNRITSECHSGILAFWEDKIQGTEIEGAKLLIFDCGAKLSELTGEGLEKINIQDGRIAERMKS